VLRNPKSNCQRSPFSLFPVHDKIRSDQLTDKTGSPVSPKRRTSGNCRIRISAGQQHIASNHLVKENFHQIMKNFLPVAAALSAANSPPCSHRPVGRDRLVTDRSRGGSAPNAFGGDANQCGFTAKFSSSAGALDPPRPLSRASASRRGARRRRRRRR
jgi:hypothetical protein